MKNHLIIFYLIVTLILLNLNVYAQTFEKNNAPAAIKSIELRPLSANNYAPIIKLGESLVLSFDQLEATGKNYTYTIIHCNYNWEPSRIATTEYIDGFATDNIRDYSSSFNTYQAYNHYQMNLPNEKTKLKISGNYIIQVKNDLDELVFTRRFMVYDPQVTVGVSVHKSQLIANFNTHQNLEFTVNAHAFRINNPGEEIKISLYQNNDWNTAINNLKPQFYSGNQLIYRYADKTLFEGGNEFLNFDTKNIRTATDHVFKIALKDLYHTYLYTDEGQNHKPYTYYPDIDGNFVIRSLSGETAITEADYTWIYFSLQLDFKPENQIYVYGNFNNWQLQEDQKMAYNQTSGVYETKLLLKQGFYNYKYVESGLNTLNLNAISGSFYQTENNYTVLVYFSEFGSRYDKLIGIGLANSRNLQN